MDKSISDTAEIFKALGDPTRLKILKLIAAQGNNLCVGFIASQLGISQPAVSQHLKVLKNAGLTEANRQGFHVHYSINKNSLENYGIKIDLFLQSFGGEFKPESSCEVKGNAKGCDRVNE